MNRAQKAAFIGTASAVSEKTTACERCAGKTTAFVMELAPIGNEPGYVVFKCVACTHETWVQSQRQPQR